MVKSLVALGAAALVTLVVGCSKSAEPNTAEKASAPPVSTARHKTLTVEDLDPSRASTATMAAKVHLKLGMEKQSRPKVALSAERVLEAFHKDGIETHPLKQGLGEPIKAGYCALSQTKRGVGFTVCEYPSAEVAREGKTLSEARYNGALGRKLFLNGETLLVVRAGRSEEALAEAKAMAAVFEKLE